LAKIFAMGGKTLLPNVTMNHSVAQTAQREGALPPRTPRRPNAVGFPLDLKRILTQMLGLLPKNRKKPSKIDKQMRWSEWKMKGKQHRDNWHIYAN